MIIDDVTVELSTVEIDSASDTIECFGPGPWLYHDIVQCGEVTMPAVATELRLLTELGRGRKDRYTPIIEFLKAGCDMDLIHRGLVRLGATPAVVDQLISALTP